MRLILCSQLASSIWWIVILEQHYGNSMTLSATDVGSTNTNGSNTSSLVTEIPDINADIRKSKIIDELLVRTPYHSTVRPTGHNGTGPVEVEIDLFLRRIHNVNDKRMEYSAELSFRQYWIDPRLSFSHLTAKIGHIRFLHLVNKSQIWMPDVFFENEKHGTIHQLVRPNLFTRIYPDGGVLQSYRFSLLLSCPMNLQAYPLDTQKCPIRLSTYGYSNQDIVLQWKPTDPIQYKAGFRMRHFAITSYGTKHCTAATAVDKFSCLELELVLERAFGYYLIQIYIPCALLVLVSWIGFWLEVTAIEARVSLGVTTILSIVTQTYGINEAVPPTSYVKALDIWTAVCQIFIFGGLLQFALINYTAKLTSPAVRRLETLGSTTFRTPAETLQDEEEKEIMRQSIGKAGRLDRISRVLFPLVFLLFNISYWTAFRVFD